jgi:hypothetical protein
MSSAIVRNASRRVARSAKTIHVPNATRSVSMLARTTVPAATTLSSTRRASAVHVSIHITVIAKIRLLKLFLGCFLDANEGCEDNGLRWSEGSCIRKI